MTKKAAPPFGERHGHDCPVLRRGHPPGEDARKAFPTEFLVVGGILTTLNFHLQPRRRSGGRGEGHAAGRPPSMERDRSLEKRGVSGIKKEHDIETLRLQRNPDITRWRTDGCDALSGGMENGGSDYGVA
jgi:hypothetical protein